MKSNNFNIDKPSQKHYENMNWEVKLALLNTASALGIKEEYICKTLEACYYGKFPGSQESSDHQIIWDHMKWYSKAAADTYKEYLHSFEEAELEL